MKVSIENYYKKTEKAEYRRIHNFDKNQENGKTSLGLNFFWKNANGFDSNREYIRKW